MVQLEPHSLWTAATWFPDPALTSGKENLTIPLEVPIVLILSEMLITVILHL